MRERNLKRAVVVTGGFHAPALKQFYEKNGWRHTFVTPNVGSGQDHYKDVMLGMQIASLPQRGRGRKGEGGTSEAAPAPLALALDPVRATTPGIDYAAKKVLIASMAASLGSEDDFPQTRFDKYPIVTPEEFARTIEQEGKFVGATRDLGRRGNWSPFVADQIDDRVAVRIGSGRFEGYVLALQRLVQTWARRSPLSTRRFSGLYFYHPEERAKAPFVEVFRIDRDYPFGTTGTDLFFDQGPKLVQFFTDEMIAMPDGIEPEEVISWMHKALMMFRGDCPAVERLSKSDSDALARFEKLFPPAWQRNEYLPLLREVIASFLMGEVSSGDIRNILKGKPLSKKGQLSFQRILARTSNSGRGEMFLSVVPGVALLPRPQILSNFLSLGSISLKFIKEHQWSERPKEIFPGIDRIAPASNPSHGEGQSLGARVPGIDYAAKKALVAALAASLGTALPTQANRLGSASKIKSLWKTRENRLAGIASTVVLLLHLFPAAAVSLRALPFWPLYYMHQFLLGFKFANLSLPPFMKQFFDLMPAARIFISVLEVIGNGIHDVANKHLFFSSAWQWQYSFWADHDVQNNIFVFTLELLSGFFLIRFGKWFSRHSRATQVSGDSAWEAMPDIPEKGIIKKLWEKSQTLREILRPLITAGTSILGYGILFLHVGGILNAAYLLSGDPASPLWLSASAHSVLAFDYSNFESNFYAIPSAPVRVLLIGVTVFSLSYWLAQLPEAIWRSVCFIYSLARRQWRQALAGLSPLTRWRPLFYSAFFLTAALILLLHGTVLHAGLLREIRSWPTEYLKMEFIDSGGSDELSKKMRNGLVNELSLRSEIPFLIEQFLISENKNIRESAMRTIASMFGPTRMNGKNDYSLDMDVGLLPRAPGGNLQLGTLIFRNVLRGTVMLEPVVDDPALFVGALIGSAGPVASDYDQKNHDLRQRELLMKWVLAVYDHLPSHEQDRYRYQMEHLRQLVSANGQSLGAPPAPLRAEAIAALFPSKARGLVPFEIRGTDSRRYRLVPEIHRGKQFAPLAGENPFKPLKGSDAVEILIYENGRKGNGIGHVAGNVKQAGGISIFDHFDMFIKPRAQDKRVVAQILAKLGLVFPSRFILLSYPANLLSLMAWVRALPGDFQAEHEVPNLLEKIEKAIRDGMLVSASELSFRAHDAYSQVLAHFLVTALRQSVFEITSEMVAGTILGKVRAHAGLVHHTARLWNNQMILMSTREDGPSFDELDLSKVPGMTPRGAASSLGIDAERVGIEPTTEQEADHFLGRELEKLIEAPSGQRVAQIIPIIERAVTRWPQLMQVPEYRRALVGFVNGVSEFAMQVWAGRVEIEAHYNKGWPRRYGFITAFGIMFVCAPSLSAVLFLWIVGERSLTELVIAIHYSSLKASQQRVADLLKQYPEQSSQGSSLGTTVEIVTPAGVALTGESWLEAWRAKKDEGVVSFDAASMRERQIGPFRVVLAEKRGTPEDRPQIAHFSWDVPDQNVFHLVVNGRRYILGVNSNPIMEGAGLLYEDLPEDRRPAPQVLTGERLLDLMMLQEAYPFFRFGFNGGPMAGASIPAFHAQVAVTRRDMPIDSWRRSFAIDLGSGLTLQALENFPGTSFVYSGGSLAERAQYGGAHLALLNRQDGTRIQVPYNLYIAGDGTLYLHQRKLQSPRKKTLKNSPTPYWALGWGEHEGYLTTAVPGIFAHWQSEDAIRNDLAAVAARRTGLGHLLRSMQHRHAPNTAARKLMDQLLANDQYTRFTGTLRAASLGDVIPGEKLFRPDEIILETAAGVTSGFFAREDDGRLQDLLQQLPEGALRELSQKDHPFQLSNPERRVAVFETDSFAASRFLKAV
ncbi:MAG: hypothetical protein HY586_07590 [Candidatus Omnitrophica bacterium]|nr:hypothetical protein [Candidatus Omnitrophota bacterium]